METRTQRARRIVEEARTLDPHRPVLREAIFEHADLRGLDLSLFDLRCSSFNNCDLRGTTLPPKTVGQGEPDFSFSRRDLTDPPIDGWKVNNGFLLRRGAQSQGTDDDSWPFAPDITD